MQSDWKDRKGRFTDPLFIRRDMSGYLLLSSVGRLDRVCSSGVGFCALSGGV